MIFCLSWMLPFRLVSVEASSCSGVTCKCDTLMRMVMVLMMCHSDKTMHNNALTNLVTSFINSGGVGYISGNAWSYRAWLYGDNMQYLKWQQFYCTTSVLVDRFIDLYQFIITLWRRNEWVAWLPTDLSCIMDKNKALKKESSAVDIHGAMRINPYDFSHLLGPPWD